MNSGNNSKIRWRCRRGMLELDVMLQNFFDQHYLQLTKKQQLAFEKLLQCEDQQLYNWLLKQEQPPDTELLEIIELIRHQ